MVMPTKYDSKMFNKIIGLCWEGLTNYQIANSLGLHYQTIARWRRVNDTLKVAMDRVREDLAKGAIERGLQRRAEGFKEEEITEKYVINDDGKPKEITRRVRYFPPDISAIGMLARLKGIGPCHLRKGKSSLRKIARKALSKRSTRRRNNTPRNPGVEIT
jgi:hypothetical protein